MRQSTVLRPPSSFVRTGFTWPAYLMLGYYAFLQAALGPLAPFLQGALHLTYTQTSLLPSAFAGASILVGLLADGLARVFRRRVRFWGGAIGMWVGAAVLMVSPSFVLALIGAFLMGASGIGPHSLPYPAYLYHYPAFLLLGLTQDRIRVGIEWIPLFTLGLLLARVDLIALIVRLRDMLPVLQEKTLLATLPDRVPMAR